MIEAALWGGVAGSSLVVGALLGLYINTPRRTIALIMGFGAGVLISALAFELTAEAFDRAGHVSVSIGLTLGALTFYAGDRIIDQRGGEHRKRSGDEQSEGSFQALTLGAVLDGIPESVAIGTTLVGGKGVSWAFVAAVFISNVPESLSAATGMRKAGHSKASILRLWTGIMLVAALSAALGYGLLEGASEDVHATIQAFAAGAILTMLADTMMPEAYEEGGNTVGLITVLGFALAFFLSMVE